MRQFKETNRNCKKDLFYSWKHASKFKMVFKSVPRKSVSKGIMVHWKVVSDPGVFWVHYLPCPSNALWFILFFSLTLLEPPGFGDFRKKNSSFRLPYQRELLRPLRYRAAQQLKRIGQSSRLHSKKKFLLGGCIFFVSDIISGGLFGPLCLALGANS